MSDSKARNTLRLKIKKTVENAVPSMNIDVTKILSEEEAAEIHRQIAQRRAALDLADKVGREGLKARLRQTMLKPTRMYDPEIDRPLEEDS